MDNIAYVIPARMESSRFPGKPLTKILGKEMILHVLDRVNSAVEKEKIFVASNSLEVLRIVDNYGFQAIETGVHPTGTDRLAEANLTIKADFLINIQGDEPAFNPDDILKSAKFLLDSKFMVMTGFCLERKDQERNDKNTIKLTFSNSKKLLYISRAPIPGGKGLGPNHFYRQVCVYGYTKEALSLFSKFQRSEFETSEDHEILRFLENDIDVGLVELSDWSVPVDVLDDVTLAEKQLRSKFKL
jgi:3-deoxy-manno-octulosonate cytidylyltransferase (CMP-KDO synthetase)